MLEIWPDLVGLALFSVVFAEIYRRILARSLIARVIRATAALEGGQDTPDAALLRTLSRAAGRTVAAQILFIDKAGHPHLTQEARSLGIRALQAIGELMPKGAGGQGPAIDLANLDLNQLAGWGISQLPKKQQALAAIAYRLLAPLLGNLKIGGGSKGGENPFLGELQK